MCGLFSLEIFTGCGSEGIKHDQACALRTPPFSPTPLKFLCGQYSVQIPQKYNGKDYNINQGPCVVMHAKIDTGTLKIA